MDELIYVGTVWFRRSVQAYSGIWQDTYTKRIFRLSATGVDDFKKQVILAEHPSESQLEFGPIGPEWTRRTRY